MRQGFQRSIVTHRSFLGRRSQTWGEKGRANVGGNVRGGEGVVPAPAAEAAAVPDRQASCQAEALQHSAQESAGKSHGRLTFASGIFEGTCRDGDDAAAGSARGKDEILRRDAAPRRPPRLASPFRLPRRPAHPPHLDVRSLHCRGLENHSRGCSRSKGTGWALPGPGTPRNYSPCPRGLGVSVELLALLTRACADPQSVGWKDPSCCHCRRPRVQFLSAVLETNACNEPDRIWATVPLCTRPLLLVLTPRP